MTRPLIGITLDTHDDGDKYESPFSYAKSIERAGGLPLLLPYQSDLALVPQFVDACDGFLIAQLPVANCLFAEPRYRCQA